MSLVVKYGWKMRSTISAAMPLPVSSTSTSTYSPIGMPLYWKRVLSSAPTLLVRKVNLPPSGMASRALAAVLLLDRGDVEAGEALARAVERGIDRRNLALPVRRLEDRGFERDPVALDRHREDRAAVDALDLEHRLEQAGEQGVRQPNPP